MAKYTIITNPTIEHAQVRLDDTKFAGVVVKYGVVKFSEVNKETGLVRFSFEYDLVENPNNLPEDGEMIKELGDTLVDLINDELTGMDEDRKKMIRQMNEQQLSPNKDTDDED